MKEETKKFIEKFKKISNKGWIEGKSKSLGNIGLTFEHELGKKADSMFFPDYYGIEIKCSTRFSRYPLSLFSVAFDGPTFPEINRIIQKYGYYDKVFKDKKVLNTNINCVTKTILNNNYSFKLEIDKKEEKIFLCVYNLNNKLIEKKSFIYLDTIKTHLFTKFNTLAYVKASKKVLNNNEYFRYYELSLYKLKTFDTFLDLLNKGVIDVCLIARIGKSGNDIGKYKNKNLLFKIKKENIEKLFNKIYTYNHDLCDLQIYK